MQNLCGSDEAWKRGLALDGPYQIMERRYERAYYAQTDGFILGLGLPILIAFPVF